MSQAAEMHEAQGSPALPSWALGKVGKQVRAIRADECPLGRRENVP